MPNGRVDFFHEELRVQSRRALFSSNEKERQATEGRANTLDLLCRGVVGFIDRLDDSVISQPAQGSNFFIFFCDIRVPMVRATRAVPVMEMMAAMSGFALGLVTRRSRR